MSESTFFKEPTRSEARLVAFLNPMYTYWQVFVEELSAWARGQAGMIFPDGTIDMVYSQDAESMHRAVRRAAGDREVDMVAMVGVLKEMAEDQVATLNRALHRQDVPNPLKDAFAHLLRDPVSFGRSPMKPSTPNITLQNLIGPDGRVGSASLRVPGAERSARCYCTSGAKCSHLPWASGASPAVSKRCPSKHSGRMGFRGVSKRGCGAGGSAERGRRDSGMAGGSRAARNSEVAGG